MQVAIQRLHELFPDTRTVLSVKTTVWCALVHDVPPAHIHAVDKTQAARYRNLLIKQAGSVGREQLDFLGPDIDIGFRIARYAARRRLVVSADLAYLLYKDRANEDHIEGSLRIVSYEQLKGVWGNRHYPIVWYEPDWNLVASTFLYDEHHQNEIIRRLRDKPPPDTLNQIVKVYEDLNLKEGAEALWALLQALDGAQEDEPPAEVTPAGMGALVEVHCVAVCFRADGRALIARREASKRRFPEHWEFGCGQLSAFETFEECLRRAYREDFGAELRFDGPPVPVKTYTIGDADEGRVIPGIIFVAEVTNPDEVRPRKHSAVDWIDPGKPDAVVGGKCVPDLADTLASAYRAWRR